MDEFFLYINEQQTGPFTLAQLQHMWRIGQINGKTLYWQHGYDEWIPLSTLSDCLEPTRHTRSIAYAGLSGARSTSTSENPPSFGTVVFFTLLFPIVGLVAGIIWLCEPRYRGSGGAILAISFVLMFIYGFILSYLFGK